MQQMTAHARWADGCQAIDDAAAGPSILSMYGVEALVREQTMNRWMSLMLIMGSLARDKIIGL